MSAPTTFHFVTANESNVGDWMSAIGIRRLLGDPPHTLHFCDEYFLPETLPWMRCLGESDLMVIGAGGLFQEYFTPFWRGMSDLAGRVPYCLWGLGVCGRPDDLSDESRALIRSIAQQSRLCVVRDEMTRQWLALPDVPPPVPCPSIVAAQEVAIPPGPRRGLLHAVHLDLVSAADYELARSVLSEHAARHGLVYHETDNRTEQGEISQLDQVMSQYASAAAVVSSRLHGCILGLAMGCKVLALASDRKVDAFMRSVGLADWICDTGDVASMGRLLRALERQRPPLESLLADALLGNRWVAGRVSRIAADLRRESKGVSR
jgi:hypothetical protein